MEVLHQRHDSLGNLDLTLRITRETRDDFGAVFFGEGGEFLLQLLKTSERKVGR